MSLLFLTGVAWELQQAGWTPLLPGAEAVQLRPMYDPELRVPRATVASVGPEFGAYRPDFGLEGTFSRR